MMTQVAKVTYAPDARNAKSLALEVTSGEGWQWEREILTALGFIPVDLYDQPLTKLEPLGILPNRWLMKGRDIQAYRAVINKLATHPVNIRIVKGDA